MNTEIKKALLDRDAAREVRKAKGTKEFDINGEKVTGRLIEGKVFFRANGDEDIYEQKGKRFYVTSDGTIRGLFNGKVLTELVLDVPVTHINATVREEMAAMDAAPNQEIVDGMVIQLDYEGSEEMLPVKLYCNRIVCSCGNIRWVKNSDVFQVKKCKPCMGKERKIKAKARIKELKKRKAAEKAV